MLRHEIYAATSFLLFAVAGFVGLTGIWVSFAILPVTVPALDPSRAFIDLGVTGCVLASAVWLIVEARSRLVNQWFAMKPRPDMAPISTFIAGHGAVIVGLAPVIPFFIVALSVISPWLGALGSAVLVAAFGSLAQASGALQFYRLARSRLEPKAPALRLRTGAVFLIALCSVALMIRTVTQSTQAAMATTLEQISLVDAQIARLAVELPLITKLLEDRVEQTKRAHTQELLRKAAGRSSDADIEAALSNRIAAETDRHIKIQALQDKISDLSREATSLSHKLVSLRSAAPALQR